MNHSFIELSEQQQWLSATTTCSQTAFQSWDFCRAMHIAHEQNIKLYYCKDNNDNQLIAPFVFRHFETYTDICTPYGYSGFSGEMNDPEWYQNWCHEMAENNIVCGYTLIHPMTPPIIKNDDIHFAHTAFIIDFNHSLDQLYKNLSTNHKRNLRNSIEKNTEIIINKDELIIAFIDLYHDFLKRISASDVYHFNSESLQFLLNSDHIHLIGIKVDGDIEAVSAFLMNNHGAEFFLSAASIKGREFSRLLMWEAISYFKNRDSYYLNLGGGISEGDNLALYKQQFGATPMDVYALKSVFQPIRFEQLCQSHNVSSSRDGYFPPYRAKPFTIESE